MLAEIYKARAAQRLLTHARKYGTDGVQEAASQLGLDLSKALAGLPKHRKQGTQLKLR